MATTHAPGRQARCRSLGWFPPLTAPFTAAAWTAFSYLAIGTVTGLVGLGLAFTAMGAAVTVIGLPVLAACIWVARGVGWWQLLMARRLGGVPEASLARPRARPGGRGWLTAAFTDRTGWKALVYLLVKVPLSVAGAFADGLWLAAIAALLYPAWLAVWQAADPGHPGQRAAGLQFGHTVLDTWPDVLIVAGAGAVAVLLMAWPVIGVAWLDARLARALLGAPARTRPRSARPASTW